MAGIIRVQRRVPGAYVPNATAHDASLPLDSLGLLTTLLAHPDGWEVSKRHLERTMASRSPRGKGGRDWVTRMLADLEAAGYLTRELKRDADGRWIWISTVYDTPCGSAVAGSAVDGSTIDGSGGDKTLLNLKHSHEEITTDTPSLGSGDQSSTPTISKATRAKRVSRKKREISEETRTAPQVLNAVGETVEWLRGLKKPPAKRHLRAVVARILRQRQFLNAGVPEFVIEQATNRARQLDESAGAAKLRQQATGDET